MFLSFLITTLAQLLILAILARVILSWVPVGRTLAPVTALVTEATDPVIRPIQRRLPLFGPLDLSPLVAILLITLVESVVLSLLAGL